MNDTMKRLAALKVAASDLVSAAGRSSYVVGAVIPDKEFDALVEILDDLEVLEKMEREDG